ncbi:DUF4142 domain-containing protein [Streptomyces roseus]|uniref:DUF4142 domain-containing protein n=1 Tax=Streptomyces roseus TaxID=66430 RepID=UPI0033E4FB33
MSSPRWITATVVVAAAVGLSAPSVAAAPTPGSADAAFAQAVHQGNLAEIAAGQDAQKNGQDSCVKEVGATLVRDHTELDAEVARLAEKGKVQLPATPTPAQQAALNKVKALAGSTGYDKAWLAAQEDGHTKTLALIDKQIRDGKDAETASAAKKARPVVAMHLAMVRGGTCHIA